MTKKISLTAVAAGLAMAGLLFACARTEPSATKETSSASAPSPSWKLNDVEGHPVTSEQFRGKVVILDFWATWCPPCRQEIPGFVALQKQYGDRGLVVIGVSLDQKGPPVVKDFMEQFGMNYPVVMGDQAMVDAFGGIEGIPTTFIINRQGHIMAKHVGYADQQTFEAAIKPLL